VKRRAMERESKAVVAERRKAVEKQFAERRKGIGATSSMISELKLRSLCWRSNDRRLSISQKLATPRNATLRNSAKVDAAAYLRKSPL
jgi:hypothetical protein